MTNLSPGNFDAALTEFQMQLPLFFDEEKPVDFKNMVIYRSSAGSGKTFTLVKDYLKLVLRDPENYRKILAITFTNKAAEEMKRKILEELLEISNNRPTETRTEIEKEFEAEGIRMQIDKRADATLQNILHNYSRFSVSTLDYFFAKVVRGFAKELDLPLKFDIDVDEKRAIDYAVDKLYGLLETDMALKSWLEDFAFSKMDADTGWSIDRNLKDLGLELFKENFRKGISGKDHSLEEIKEFVKKLKKIRDDYANGMKSGAQKALDLIKSHGLTTSDFSGGSRSWANTFNKILRGDYVLTDTFLKTVRGENTWYAKSSEKSDRIEQVQQAGLQSVCDSILTFHEDKHRSYNAAKSLLKNIYSYGILGMIDKNLEDYRSENNIVLLSDNAFLLNEVIDDNDAPIIYEKIGARYKHILIDEFQDTSFYQWRNILPLVKNVLSEFGNTLIVGDVKQSIYRWRGGDMRLLISGVQRDLAEFSDQTREEHLDKNYRSASNIVYFNNEFFKIATKILSLDPDLPANNHLIADTFRHHEQTPVKSETGYVEVRLFSADNDKSWKELAKERTIEVIKNAQDVGYHPGDIMILVDKWDLGYDIAGFLIDNGYQVITDKSLKVENNSIVRLLINAIRWLHDREDALARTNLLYLYLEVKGKLNKDMDAVFSDYNNEGIIFENEMPAYFLSNLKVFLRLPLYELVENLIAVFGLGGQTDNFVLKFQELCLEQSVKGKNDLQTFLDWWEESKDDLTVVSSDSRESISVMTVHKAKGLQKPIVIMPFANYVIRTKPRTIFWTSELEGDYKKFNMLPLVFEKELKNSDFENAYRREHLEGMLEWLNVTYVAFTRAEQRLYIFSENFKDNKAITRLNKLIYNVFEDADFGHRTYWDETTRYFAWGDESSVVPAVSYETEKSAVIFDFPSTSITGGPNVSIKSESERFFLLFDNEKSEKIKNGILLHRIFERLETTGDLPAAIDNLENEGIMTPGEKKVIMEETNMLFSNPQIKSWFDGSWEIYNERSIISPEGLSRPDRVMVKDGRAVIVDYKTGEKATRYEKQLHKYGQLLKNMGYTDIRKYIIYFTDREVVEVH